MLFCCHESLQSNSMMNSFNSVPFAPFQKPTTTTHLDKQKINNQSTRHQIAQEQAKRAKQRIYGIYHPYMDNLPFS